MNDFPEISMRQEAAEDLRSLFNAKDSNAAHEELKRLIKRYQDSVPGLATWAEETVLVGLNFYQSPAEL